MLRSQKFIPLRKAKRVSPPILGTSAPGPNAGDIKTVEEQIYGASDLPSQLPGVTLICEDDEHNEKTNDDALAAKYGPTTADAKFYSNSPERVAQAVQERINDKHVAFDMTANEREEIKTISESFAAQMRDSPEVDKIASWLLFGDLKSNKWTITRAEMALNVLMWTLNPSFTFSAAIKLEPMPKGKPPRMLIADGDAGAVMSALTIGVLERYLCRYYKHMTIKGKPKALRMEEICRQAMELRASGDMAAYEAFLMENDGSAWDTCCKLILRELTENPVTDALFERLYKYFTPYNWYQEARQTADTKKQYKLMCSTNKLDVTRHKPQANYTSDDIAKAMCKKRTTIQIDSIRRSGDRGTSILNWLVNVICWAWVLTGSCGDHFVHSNAKVCTDIFGVNRRFKAWFEGDDSLLWLTGRHFTPCELEVLGARWTQLGHRPKLFMRTQGDIAEFVGWKFFVTPHGIDESTAIPDVPRMLRNVFYSTAKEAVEAAKSGDKVAFGRVVGPALIARAGAIATRVPTVARWLTRLSSEVCDKITDEMFSRDDQFRMGTDAVHELTPEWWKNDEPEIILDKKFGTFIGNVLKDVSGSIAAGGLQREATLAVKHGWVKSTDEWHTFAGLLEAVNLSTSDADYRSIVPPGMM